MKVIFTIWNLKKKYINGNLFSKKIMLETEILTEKVELSIFFSFTSLMADLRQVKT